MFFIFFAIILISMKIDTKKKMRVIFITAIVLYGLSELSSYLKQLWFPSNPNIMVSENGIRAFRISDKGQVETAILKPIVEIKSAELKDSRNRPGYDPVKFPYLYNIIFSFDVINGIEHKNELIIEEILLMLEINDGQFEKKFNFKQNGTIKSESSQNFSTITERPIFIVYKEGIKSCKLSISCKFKNFKDLKSNPFDVIIN